MPVLRLPLQPEGAVVDILAGWSAAGVQQLRTSLKPVPSPVNARAVLDTGAEITCLDTGIIQNLACPPPAGQWQVFLRKVASITLMHPSGNARANLVVRNLSVLGLSLASFGCEALLGRDVLAVCHFIYSGPRNVFRLAY